LCGWGWKGASAPLRAIIWPLYAQGLLPLLMPLAVLLMEPRGRRAQAIALLVGVGGVVCLWDSVGLVAFPSRTFIQCHSIAYRNPLTGNLYISYLYLAATCGALLLSSHTVVRWYGALNVAVLLVVELLREYAFASVWCFYAAGMSVMIYWQFRSGILQVPAIGYAIKPTCRSQAAHKLGHSDTG
jgi:hypothetical protein